jgi:hypothetical protein
VKYFLIVYDQREATLRSIEEFDESERGRASEARLLLEGTHRDEPGLEIVVLGSGSLATLKRTHGRYFKSVGELASEV